MAHSSTHLPIHSSNNSAPASRPSITRVNAAEEGGEDRADINAIAKWASSPLPVAAFCISPDLLKQTDDPSHLLYLPDRPLPGSEQEFDEIQELIELQCLRDDANGLDDPQASRKQRPLSVFLAGVQTGRDLGMRFADESPEAIYRTVLNTTLNQKVNGVEWSLEAKAQLRMVLDATMYNARLIAWHYKWRSNRGISVTYRPRPTEIAPEINVLYHADSPSYPSSHSTLAGAASHLLSQFSPQRFSQRFPQQHNNLDDLADNIGVSCLWAGVNYRSDHINGLRLGRAVAAMLLQQMGKR